MFSCAYDPGLAIFLAEHSASDDPPQPGLLEWACFAATLAMAGAALVIPA